MKESVIRCAAAFGIDVRKAKTAMLEVPYFLHTLRQYRHDQNGNSPRLRLRDIYPALTDRRDSAGVAGGHYFYQDLWAARKVFERRPAKHIDIGSRVDGFIAHLLTFMPVTQIDIRPLKSNIEGLSFTQDDATLMTSFADNSVDSLSSLHVVEHFGLGRYGDPVDPHAWRRAVRSFVRVLRPGGRLYLSVPAGRERVEFNAHRVLSPDSVMDACRELELVSFAAVHDDDRFESGLIPSDVRDEEFACGLFEFTKPEIQDAAGNRL